MKAGILLRYVILAGSFPVIALICWADAQFDPQVSLSLLYLIPVALVAWFFGRIAGIGIGFTAIVSEAYATLSVVNPQAYMSIELWNSFGRMAFYALIVILLNYIATLLEKERLSARKDYLTGLNNSRSFYELAEIEIDRSRRSKLPITIAYFDVDGFKQVNDRMGHPEGDRLLKAIASALGACVRRIDMAARLGGDEFAVLLPLDDFPAAQAAIARIRERLLDTVRGTWPVTFSVGAITYAAPPSTVSEMVTAADELMYGVKKSGKNDIRHITKD
ncbi:MAG TPA: diguanylate cyclase [Spirochaetota bacterium]|nr:diguanylate cyclase [Spirochaetota bacterium]HOS39586.1 diguanylate cyclase [Spirochaetota bacterium]HPI22343.1 diguanylate cyclase [Spirochaetota bacterium]HPU89229.1 diguanylate cyclase [Spirochaetota bacterium]